jgi:hypothetical protein
LRSSSSVSISRCEVDPNIDSGVGPFECSSAGVKNISFRRIEWDVDGNNEVGEVGEEGKLASW